MPRGSKTCLGGVKYPASSEMATAMTTAPRRSPDSLMLAPDVTVMLRIPSPADVTPIILSSACWLRVGGSVRSQALFRPVAHCRGTGEMFDGKVGKSARKVVHKGSKQGKTESR